MLLVTVATRVTLAQEFDEKFEHWPVHPTIKGTVVIGRELDDPSILREVFARRPDPGRVTLLLAPAVGGLELLLPGGFPLLHYVTTKRSGDRLDGSCKKYGGISRTSPPIATATNVRTENMIPRVSI